MYQETLFKIFDVDVTLYGICLAAGIVCCFLFLMYAFRKLKFNESATELILLVGILATAFGVFFAMIFQAIYDYLADPSEKFVITGRMTFMGGLLGGVVSYLLLYGLYVFVIAPRAKTKWLQNDANAGLSDALPVIPVGICIAHMFGRIGCFFAGCCAGAPTNAWYGLPCSFTYPGQNVVPVQLFEAAFLAVLALVMYVLHRRFRFNCNISVYAIGYGIWRFFIEYLRADDRGAFVGSLTPSQFWSIVMIICGVGYLFLYRFVLKRCMKHPEEKIEMKHPEGKTE